MPFDPTVAAKLRGARSSTAPVIAFPVTA
jgi:hypothetical protein